MTVLGRFSPPLTPLPGFKLFAPVAIAYVFLGWFYSSPWGHDNSHWREVVHWLAGGFLAWRFWRGLGHAERYSGKTILGWGAFLALLAVLVPPFHSTDIYGYINRGWQQLQYHTNPYVTAIDQIPQWGYDPMLTDHWVTNPCPYGFGFALWAQALCWLSSLLAPGQLWATMMIFKSTNAIALWLSAALLAWGLKPLNGFKPSQAAYTVLWNPILLLHHVTNGHNDILLGLGVVVAGVSWLRGWTMAVLPALTTAFFIKYATAVSFPPLLVGFVRLKQWPGLWLGGAISLAILALLASPYIGDWQQFQWQHIASNAGVPVGSISAAWLDAASVLPNVIKKAMVGELLGGTPLGNLISKGTLGVALLALMVIPYRLGFLNPVKEAEPTFHNQNERFWAMAMVMLMVLITVLSKKYYPWYVGMFMAGACCLPALHPVRRWAILLGMFQMIGFTFLGRSHVINALLMIVLPTLIAFWPSLKAFAANPKTLFTFWKAPRLKPVL
jgi:hypothetical protein